MLLPPHPNQPLDILIVFEHPDQAASDLDLVKPMQGAQLRVVTPDEALALLPEAKPSQLVLSPDLEPQRILDVVMAARAVNPDTMIVLRDIAAHRAELEKIMRFQNIAASIPGFIFRFRRPADGGEVLDYISPRAAEIWEPATGEDVADPAMHWSRVVEEDVEKVETSLARALETGRNWDCRYRIRVPDGRIKWLHGRGRISQTDDSAMIVDGMILDITDQVAVEEHLDEVQQSLVQAQKLEAIGKLTGGIAHDFNNLLAVILGNLEEMEDCDDAGEREQMRRQAIKAVLRGRDLTRSLLTFARKSPFRVEDVDVNAALKAFEGLLQRTLLDKVRITTVTGDGPLVARTDSGLLENALLNLAINARDAMGGRGELTLRAGRVEIGPDEREVEAGTIAPGAYVEITVSDNGRGIAPEDLEHVFEPFFSTKEPGQGSGLGLAMVQGFARQSRGLVRIHSEPGRGTAVTLLLPEADGGRSQPAGGGAHVLYVEDEGQVRDITWRIMRRLGYEVESVPTAREAIEAFGQGGRFDIAVLDNFLGDQIMGRDLARRFKALDPACRILLLSGYHDDQHQGLPEGVDMFLQKPVSRAILKEALEQLGLASRAAGAS